MKRYIFVFVGCIVMFVLGGYLARSSDPDLNSKRQDATLMHPPKVDTSGGMIRIHGDWTVLRPSGLDRDHAMAIRLTIVRPADERVLYTEDLVKVNYHRTHPRKPYRVDKDMKFDASGLDVKVAAVDLADGRVFGSIVTHGVAVASTPQR
jgi:hypothetical protein